MSETNGASFFPTQPHMLEELKDFLNLPIVRSLIENELLETKDAITIYRGDGKEAAIEFCTYLYEKSIKPVLGGR